MKKSPDTATERDKLIYVTLRCEDVLIFRTAVPRVGSLLWCTTHSRYELVTRVRGQWRWACLECRQGRRGGSVRWNSQKFAQRHVESFSHVVRVWCEDVLDADHILWPNKSDESLPF